MSAMKDVILMCFTVTFLVNLGYWSGRKTEQLSYFPTAGWLKNVLLICCGACAVASVMWFLRLVSFEVAGTSAIVLITMEWAYSIWFRWHLRHGGKLPEATHEKGAS